MEYWGHSNISDWDVGSRWEHRRTDGSGIADVIGTVLEAEPSRRLVITFDGPDERRDPPSRVTFEIEPYEEIIRLTVAHEDIADEANYKHRVSKGWPAVLANLKSLLETGHALPQPPWEMYAEKGSLDLGAVSSFSRFSDKTCTRRPSMPVRMPVRMGEDDWSGHGPAKDPGRPYQYEHA